MEKRASKEIRDEETGDGRRASSRANLFNDDAFSNNKSAGSLEIFFRAHHRLASATTCATRVHARCT